MQTIKHLWLLLTKGTTKNPIVMHYFRRLFWYSAIFNFRITAKYIPGNKNTIADVISRMHDLFYFWRCMHYLFLFNGLESVLQRSLLCNSQGLETNWISWNTAIRCNNNNGSFIFSHAQFQLFLHDVWLEPDLHSDHVVKVNRSQIFSPHDFWLKFVLEAVISINNYISEASWVMTISYDQYWSEQMSRSIEISKTTTVIKWNIK